MPPKGKADAKAELAPPEIEVAAPEVPAPDAGAAAPNEFEGLSKRMVALHVGYVGTAYKGSSVNRTLGDDATVEAVLETAIFKAGMMKEANYGSFGKVRWTRASRTDKGVHSLGTVVSLKLLVHDDRFTSLEDKEGLTHAELINAHLPPSIRVFAVQRCHKKFNARHTAASRVYEYYLPSALLELANDGSEADKARVALFRRSLGAFHGNHAFHNFTKMKAHAGEHKRSRDYNQLRGEAMEAARQRGDDPRVNAAEVKELLKAQMADEKEKRGVATAAAVAAGKARAEAGEKAEAEAVSAAAGADQSEQPPAAEGVVAAEAKVEGEAAAAEAATAEAPATAMDTDALAAAAAAAATAMDTDADAPAAAAAPAAPAAGSAAGDEVVASGDDRGTKRPREDDGGGAGGARGARGGRGGRGDRGGRFGAGGRGRRDCGS
ncbi:hypothetical protein FOA52_015504 [Chlamydomonas sp. UWO 241]|nr:hypothetical protein FOA52_015504 [Chlamydomonas sp. UWO 241]